MVSPLNAYRRIPRRSLPPQNSLSTLTSAPGIASVLVESAPWIQALSDVYTTLETEDNIGQFAWLQ
jgi:hypothetical protein